MPFCLLAVLALNGLPSRSLEKEEFLLIADAVGVYEFLIVSHVHIRLSDSRQLITEEHSTQQHQLSKLHKLPSGKSGLSRRNPSPQIGE